MALVLAAAAAMPGAGLTAEPGAFQFTFREAHAAGSPDRIVVELLPDEAPVFAQFYAGLSDDQQGSLVRFADRLAPGDRGPLAMRLVAAPAAEQQRFLYFLGLMTRDEQELVARMFEERPMDKWDVVFEFLRSGPPEELRLVLLFTGGAGDCPQTYRLDGEVPGAAFVCTPEVTTLLYNWNVLQTARVVMGVAADRTATRWQAQILWTEVGYPKTNTPAVLAESRRRTGRTALKWENEHICGAVNIGGGWVLTAAHCVQPWGGTQAEFFDEVQVRLGAFSLIGEGTRYPIDAMVVHARYSTVQGGSDIALLRLRDAPALAAPVHILSSAPSKAAGNTASVTGWGFTGAAKFSSDLRDLTGKVQTLSDELQQASLALFPSQDCNRNPAFVGRGYSISSGQLCAGSREGQASCRGDSGGPLVTGTGHVRRLVGLVSYAPGCGFNNAPTVYTDVSHYARWIDNAKIAAVSRRIVRLGDPR